MSDETSGKGQYDELLSAEKEAARQAGKENAAYLLMFKRLRKDTGLGVMPAKAIVDEYCVRNWPERAALPAQAEQTGARATKAALSWVFLFLVLPVWQTVRYQRMTHPSRSSFVVVALLWMISGGSLAEAYWVKGDARKRMMSVVIVWSVCLVLVVWLFCSHEYVDQRCGWMMVFLAVCFPVLALLRKRRQS